MFEGRAGLSLDAKIPLPSIFSRYSNRIDVALRAALDGFNSNIYDTHRYYMGWTQPDGSLANAAKGKRLRPTLALLAAEAAGGEIERVMPIAVALEYVHNFSLIHDDLEDRDRFRHHRPTVWVIWGEPIAIISGNAMLKIADGTSKKLVEKGVAPLIALEIEKNITENYLRMMEGQYLDIRYESIPSISIKQYLDMIEKKTGALIETSFYSGSLVGPASGPNRALSEHLRSIGYEIGRIFQIRDDILGVWGSTETGKPVGTDIRRKKKALPIVHVLNSSSPTSKKKIHEIFLQKELSDNDVDLILEIMESSDTQKYCQSLANECWERAHTVLNSLELAGETATYLSELGRFLLVRES